MIRNKILSYGELLIDFFSLGREEPEKFIKHAGGAPANVAAAVAALGGKSYFVGKVGKDMFGDFLINFLDEKNVRMNYCLQGENQVTSVAFVSHDEQGERLFHFYRDPHSAADLAFHKEDWKEVWLKDAAFLHCGSNCQAAKSGDESTQYGMKLASSKGALVSYDPNLRHNLWNDSELLRLRVHRAFSLADIIELSEEEARFLFPNTKEKEIVAQLFGLKCQLVLLTRGPKGCTAFTSAGISVKFNGIKVNTIDTTGAGDAFIGAVLHCLTAEGAKQKKSIDLNLSEEKLMNVLNFANNAAAISVSRLGGIDSMPSEKEVENFLRGS